MCNLEDLQRLKVIINDLIKAKKDLDKTSKRKMDMGFNCTRARKTTVNAKYQTDAEHLKKMYWKFKEESEKL